jgi:aminomethyltransferase
LQEQNSQFGANLRNVGSDYALLALQGPLAVDVLESISDLPVRDLRYYRFLEGELLGCPVLLSRTGYTASDGFELYLSPQHAEASLDKTVGSRCLFWYRTLWSECTR